MDQATCFVFQIKMINAPVCFIIFTKLKSCILNQTKVVRLLFTIYFYFISGVLWMKSK